LNEFSVTNSDSDLIITERKKLFEDWEYVGMHVWTCIATKQTRYDTII